MDTKLTRRTLSSLGITAGASVLFGTNLVASRGAKAQDATPSPADAEPGPPPEVANHPDDWPVWHGNIHATRSASNSPINGENVGNLEVAWRFPVTTTGYYGNMVASPLIVGDVVYLQDAVSNVYALNRESGELIWQAELDGPTYGPNGLAIGYGMLFGQAGESGDAFALNMENGEVIWRRPVVGIMTERLFGAPAVYDNVMYLGTTGGGGGRSALYALDVQTGDALWSFNTVAENGWNNPAANGGAGIWYQPSFDEEGNLYFGTANPVPAPGSEEFPNGATRPGENLYSSSMVSLDAKTGAIRWFYQDKPHDLVDHDFQNTPVIAHVESNGERREFAIGSGKTGNIAAVETTTGQLIWKIPVGIHNAYGDGHPLPEDGEYVETYPGIYGGVETGLAYRDNTIYAAVVVMVSTFSATNRYSEQGTTDFETGTGLLLSIDAVTGQINWQVDLPQLPYAAVTAANDVLFVPLMNGTFNAFSANDGTQLFKHQAGAGFNAPTAVAGDLVVAPSCGFLFGEVPEDLERKFEVIAFRLPAE